MNDSEHIKRGMTVETDVSVTTEWDGMDDGNINSVWHCGECGDKLELRSRRGNDAYVSIGCGCGAVEMHLRICDVFDLDIDKWESIIKEE